MSLSQIIERLKSEEYPYDPIVLILSKDPKAREILERTGCTVLLDDSLSQDRHVVGGWDTLKPLHLFFRLRSRFRSKTSMRRFRTILREIEPDLVYLNALPVHRYACAANSHKIPVILHVREIVLDDYHRFYRNRYRETVNRCVSLTIYIGSHEKQMLGARKHCEIIPNYVDLHKWQLLSARETSEPPTILFTGGLNHIKGIQVLLPALALLKGSAVPFRCVFLGVAKANYSRSLVRKLLMPTNQSNSWQEVQKFVDKANLANCCNFKPFVTDPVNEYRIADIVVFPSTEPHFARPLVEAGAMRLPVVASDLPGPQDVVEDGLNGFLVHPNDPQALANALGRLIASPKLRQQMGQANYEVVASRFNAAINEQRIIDLIDNMIEENC